jgi:hypothetical protein
MGLDMFLFRKTTDEVAYWRKANAIHGWIIKHTNSVDDCTPISLTKEDLIKLRDTCKMVLTMNNAELAMEWLPPSTGFFFGNNQINEWYWSDIQDTVDKLNEALAHSVDDAMFEYQASW